MDTSVKGNPAGQAQVLHTIFVNISDSCSIRPHKTDPGCAVPEERTLDVSDRQDKLCFVCCTSMQPLSMVKAVQALCDVSHLFKLAR